MKLADIKTLQEIAREYHIPFPTLQARLNSKKCNMIEGVDYKKLGKRLPTLLSPSGVKKITKNLRDSLSCEWEILLKVGPKISS